MTRRLTVIADGARDGVDMSVSLPKTYTYHVHKRATIKVSTAEAKAAKSKYKYRRDFCPRRFKSDNNMQIHRCNCIYNYDTRQEVFEVEKVVGAFGHVDNR